MFFSKRSIFLHSIQCVFPVSFIQSLQPAYGDLRVNPTVFSFELYYTCNYTHCPIVQGDKQTVARSSKSFNNLPSVGHQSLRNQNPLTTGKKLRTYYIDNSADLGWLSRGGELVGCKLLQEAFTKDNWAFLHGGLSSSSSVAQAYLHGCGRAPQERMKVYKASGSLG